MAANTDLPPQTIYTAMVGAVDNATGWEESDDPIYPERQTGAALEKSFVVRLEGRRAETGYMEVHGTLSASWVIEVELFRRKITNLTTLKNELWTAENAVKTAVYAAMGPEGASVQAPIEWRSSSNPAVRNGDWYSQIMVWTLDAERTTAA